MIRNFSRINNYYNRLEATNDWLKLCQEVIAAGYSELTVKNAPPEGAGWRKIDKCIAKLRKEFEEAVRIDKFHEQVVICLTDLAHIAVAEPATVTEAVREVYGEGPEGTMDWLAKALQECAEWLDEIQTRESVRP